MFSLREQPTYHGYQCAFDRDAEELQIWKIENASNWTMISTTAFSTTAADGDWRRIRADYDGAAVYCFYEDASNASAQLQISGADVSMDMSGQAGLRVYNDRAAFTSYAAYH